MWGRCFFAIVRRAHRPARRVRPVPNNPEGIAPLGAFCQAHQADLAAMEATGGYEQQAFQQLSEQGLPVAILNARAVRQFAERNAIQRSRRICGCTLELMR